MVHAGNKSYAYWITQSTFNVDQTMTNTGTPFNPLLKFVPPTPTYKEETIRFFSSLTPSIIYTTEYDPTETSNEAIYKDPLFMLNIFTNKVVPQTWANTVCNIEGLFTTQSDVSSIDINYLLYDQSGGGSHISRTITGVKITEWGLKCEGGKLLKEVWKWKGSGVRNETVAPDIAANFDDGAFDRTGVDGGFADWDNQGPFHSTDMTVTWNSTDINGIHIKDWDLNVKVPETFVYIYSSREPATHMQDAQVFEFNASGKLETQSLVNIIDSLYSSKAKNTLKIQFGARSNYYIQFTQAYLSKLEFDGIPEAGKPCDCSLTLTGGTQSNTNTACSFKWEGRVATDPSGHIVHAP